MSLAELLWTELPLGDGNADAMARTKKRELKLKLFMMKDEVEIMTIIGSENEKSFELWCLVYLECVLVNQNMRRRWASSSALYKISLTPWGSFCSREIY
jgi:hypothetical protein